MGADVEDLFRNAKSASRVAELRSTVSGGVSYRGRQNDDGSVAWTEAVPNTQTIALPLVGSSTWMTLHSRVSLLASTQGLLLCVPSSLGFVISEALTALNNVLASILALLEKFLGGTDHIESLLTMILQAPIPGGRMDERNRETPPQRVGHNRTKLPILKRNTVQTQTPDFNPAQIESQLQTDVTMNNPCSDGDYGCGEGDGATLAGRGSQPTDEHQASLPENATVTRCKQSLVGTVESKVRSLGPQGKAQGKAGEKQSMGTKKGNTTKKGEGATPFPVYSLTWLFSNSKSHSVSGVLPTTSFKDLPIVENTDASNPAAPLLNDASKQDGRSFDEVGASGTTQIPYSEDGSSGVGTTQEVDCTKYPLRARTPRKKKALGREQL
ncbi:hypothetical protein NDU88_007576 [Pleurodeles waltl]|uniref:Uncharacterized protein n=1 Tax=Pleurodeles waltl TaxID=8319 RepID=A0AAV7P2K1_PLEWA|nr:hypothetical protein NDU88_007576 [Pleurodeles waltl]